MNAIEVSEQAEEVEVAPFPFFDLPSELRATILEHVLLLPEGQFVPTHRAPDFPPDTTEIPPIDLFYVCLQMYHEASAIFYNQNIFCLYVQQRRLPKPLMSDGGFLSPQCRSARRRVRNLRMITRRVGGEFQGLIQPVLSDMILSGRLRNLEFRFYPPKMPRLNWYQFGMDEINFGSPPFQALLGILTDPDLTKVEIWVWHQHWLIWCPYHDQQSLLAPCTGGRNWTGKDWIKIDWEALVQKHGVVKKVIRIGERDSDLQ